MEGNHIYQRLVSVGMALFFLWFTLLWTEFVDVSLFASKLPFGIALVCLGLWRAGHTLRLALQKAPVRLLFESSLIFAIGVIAAAQDAARIARIAEMAFWAAAATPLIIGCADSYLMSKDRRTAVTVGAPETVLSYEAVLSGQSNCSRQARDQLLQFHQHARSFGLTPREEEVFSWLKRGYTLPAIGRELYISRGTVDTHVRHIYQKPGVHSRDEMRKKLGL